jgi:hypothetical protein
MFSIIKSSISSMKKNGNDVFMSFAMIQHNSKNTRYYILGIDAIYVLNDEYKYISEKSFNFPTQLKIIGNNLYIVGDSNICKTDRDLNVLIQKVVLLLYPNIKFFFIINKSV